MKIGIFGDSYGAEFGPNIKSTKLWCNILRDLGDYEVANFCERGASLWLIYDRFIKNYSSLDRVILLIPNSGRMTINRTVNGITSNLNITGLTRVEYELRTNRIPADRSFWLAAEQYYHHLQQTDYDESMHRLMLADIQRIRPDAVLVPCFEPKQSLVSLQDNLHLFQIHLIDIVYYLKQYPDLARVAPLPNDWHFGIEKRSAHMNDANNKIFADIIHQWIQTGRLEMSLSDFVNPTEPIEYYFDVAKIQQYLK